jgi:mono/diheme cytochrome c family protein
MFKNMKTVHAFFLTLLCASAVLADPGVDYLREVKPILMAQCYNCHGARAQKGSLRVDTLAFMLKGGSHGPIVVPKRANDSLLVKILRDEVGELSRMPYKKDALPTEQITIIAAWIDQGAVVPADELPDDGKSHWAFQPPEDALPPAVRNAAWTRNPIDRFILAELEKRSLTPSGEAERTTLLRRVHLDLIGLPPTPAELQAFLADSRPDAYDRTIDRLLNSPHYGERQGRHWLDLARYADTNGYSIDSFRQIWLYRDWVIEAFNRDLPFDQFTIEQYAGDMLPQATTSQRIATGFHRNTQINEEGGVDREQFRVDAVADRVNTTGVVFLGLTLGCARCHDHKFDPITHKEYYQIFAFLNNQDEPNLPLATADLVARRDALQARRLKLEAQATEQQKAYLSLLTDQDRAAIHREIQVILNLNIDQRDKKQKLALLEFAKRVDAKFHTLLKSIADLEAQEPQFPTTMVLAERAKPRETYIHIQGDFTRKGETVRAGVPDVLPRLSGGSGSTRLELARWLVSSENPLTARVTVNRMWQQFFGKGIVETENDFGTQGTPPTHPELLDWLAREFVRSKWSTKAMHRLIVTSATYRQSSRARPELVKVDPYNRLLGRQNRLRLEAEVVRDAALAVSGLLSSKIGGPSVFPPQPDGIYRFTQVPRVWTAELGANRYRRGMYTHFQRSAPYPGMMVFDAPDAVSSCTRRVRSNTPLQALTLLNDQTFLEMAAGLGERARKADIDDSSRMRMLMRTALGREPGSEELQRLSEFLAVQRREYEAKPALTKGLVVEGGPEAAAWFQVARAVLNLDEFITRE